MLFDKKFNRSLETVKNKNKKFFGEYNESVFDDLKENEVVIDEPEDTNYELSPEDLEEMKRADEILAKQRRESGLRGGTEFEKKDMAALLLSSLLVFLPAIFLVLGIFALVTWLITLMF
ncbi:MAG: hypothetical protein ACLRZ7_03555 [Lachnospiraceae bacterium]